jgi:hypothetical protein
MKGRDAKAEEHSLLGLGSDNQVSLPLREGDVMRRSLRPLDFVSCGDARKVRALSVRSRISFHAVRLH